MQRDLIAERVIIDRFKRLTGDRLKRSQKVGLIETHAIKLLRKKIEN